MSDKPQNNGEDNVFFENHDENKENATIDNICETPQSEPFEEAISDAENMETEQTVESNDDSSDNTGAAMVSDTDVQEFRNTHNSYEWNSDTSAETDDKKKKNKDSGKGFRVFIAVMLSVFTVSSLLLCAMVVMDAFSDTRFSFSYKKDSKNPAQETATSEEFDYSSVKIDTPNYVAFDFKEHEGQVLSIPEVAAKCSPSSVGIISEIETSYTYPFYFAPTTGIAEASGSGFIYSADGYIITNHHVIEDAVKVRVILSDNKEFEAEIVGSDELSDIAVLKINVDESTTLIPMEIGNSDELVVGESVVAIGCPAGIEFIGTVTDGIVSAINRNVEITDSYGNVQKNMALIQTNATINHGNSGGPLINTKGQVIGINTLKLSSDYEGIGFSIPINGAVPVIKQLMEHGKVVERTEEDFAYGKGIIGISGSAITEEEAEYYDIPQGVLVVQINREGSAAKAGLRRGDIITHYNGKKVKTIDDINNEKGSARAGTTVTVTVYRDNDNSKGETLDITFKLDAQ